MLEKVRETLENLGVQKKDSILVACSGGPDSVALLLLLTELAQRGGDYAITVAHFNHGLRGSESDGDARFVEGLAKTMGLECIVQRGDVKGRKRLTGETIQEAARALRYEFLREVRAQKGIKWIATAHTADDQAEEVILRLLRGTSLAGISGIPARTEDGIIRPLLQVEKNELLAYLADRGQNYRQDSSNQSSKYLRNLVRKRVIPELKRINPSILSAVSRTTRLLSEDNEFLEALAQRAYKEAIVFSDGAQVEFSVARLKELERPILRRVMKRALRHLNPQVFRSLRMEHLDALLALAGDETSVKGVTLPKQIVAKRVYDRLKFYKKEGDTGRIQDGIVQPFTPTRLNGPGRVSLSGTAGALEIKDCGLGLSFNRHRGLIKRLYVDAGRLNFPLTVRSRQEGERFWPLGAPRPFKLKEFLISRKVPRHVRSIVPLILSDDDVVAVAGIEVSEKYKVSPETKQVYEVTWEPPEAIERELVPRN